MTADPMSLTSNATKRPSVAATVFDWVVLRHPLVTIVCILAVVGFLAFEARNFTLDASAETLVLENDESLRYSRLVSRRYGQRDFLVLTYTTRGDLFSEGELATLARLKQDVESVERVSSVMTIFDVPLFQSQSSPLSLKELTEELPTLQSPTTDIELARTELTESPVYRELLISADGKTTALMITFTDDQRYRELRAVRDELRQKRDSGSFSAAEQTELDAANERFRQYRNQWRRQRHADIGAIREIMERYRKDADLFLGGVSMIADDMITFIKSDLKVFGLGVLLFLILMLGIIFKAIRWICLPMLCCLVSAVVMIGLLGWLRWEVTVISSNFISLQLIITMAIAVHLVVRYREIFVDDPEAPNRRLILDTVRHKLKPCLFAILTTIAGFGSLVVCDILPVVTFGWMMIVGLAVSLVVTFLLFPAVLVLLPKQKKSDVKHWRFSLTPLLARLTETHGTLILAACVLALVASGIGISKLQVENCFIDYFNENTEIYQGMKMVDQNLGGTTPLDVTLDFGTAEEAPDLAQTDTGEADDAVDEFDEFDLLDEEAGDEEKYWFTAEKVSRIKDVHSYLESLPETGKVISLASLVSVVEQLKEDDEPLDSLELALLYNETPDKFKDMLVKPYVSVEHSQARFWVRVRDSEKTLRRNELLQRIDHDLNGDSTEGEKQVHLSGMLVLYNNMLQSLFGSQILTLGITMLVLSGMFLVLFKSLKIALIAMLPNILPVAVVLGVMGWSGMPLDMMTITIAAIGMGIAVDNTIHYIHRFKREFEKDRNYVQTMYRCHGSIGYAMYYTSATIIIGFSILALSNFTPTVYFGLLTGLSMFIALLADLAFLPRMLIVTRPFGKEG